VKSMKKGVSPRPHSLPCSNACSNSDGMVVYTNPQLKAPININSELAIKHSLAEGSVGAAECYPQTGPAAGASVTFTYVLAWLGVEPSTKKH